MRPGPQRRVGGVGMEAAWQQGSVHGLGQRELGHAAAAGRADVNSAPNLLHCACAANNMGAVLYLLTVPGLLVNAVNSGGYTALHAACDHGHAAVVSELLTVPGLLVNATTNWDRTALHLACDGGHLGVVLELLKHPSIDVNAVTGGRTSALDLALHEACYRGHETVALELLKHPSINVNAIDGGALALHVAAHMNCVEVARALLAHPGLAALPLLDRRRAINVARTAAKSKMHREMEALLTAHLEAGVLPGLVA